ncbi:hypothetical protein EJ08DRAFT_657386 [Tothia fuscella]|uniref:Uncharacterized protein n=1 Tax=Tothia fuscella TaxID=1048955 RepID=A0A9P4NYR7_9PEZI|nr:hypothetical protein EJ08DRAFT_657386 [Tothia fuscella]
MVDQPPNLSSAHPTSTVAKPESNAEEKTKPAGFLDLPGEIRNQVYRNILQDSSWIVRTHDNNGTLTFTRELKVVGAPGVAWAGIEIIPPPLLDVCDVLNLRSVCSQANREMKTVTGFRYFAMSMVASDGKRSNVETFLDQLPPVSLNSLQGLMVQVEDSPWRNGGDEMDEVKVNLLKLRLQGLGVTLFVE